jgi:uncharacterized protein DUF1499
VFPAPVISTTEIEFAIAALLLAVIGFVPRVRRIVSTVLGFAIAALAIAISVGGTAVLMNNVSISESPGMSARVVRFLTVDQAATSEKGLGSAECPHGWPGAQLATPAATPAAAPPGPAAIADEEEDSYPELVRHGYPGIPRARLFQLAQQTVGELGGWKLEASSPGDLTLDCVYTTRILRLEDDVRIMVTPKSEIDICSRSQKNSWLAIFLPGDFGGNIGHIKEFYQALEPNVDAVYKEQESRMKGR